MIQRLLLWFSLATLVSALAVVATFLLSRAMGHEECFNAGWERFSVGITVGVVGLLLAAFGVRQLYSVEDGFMPFAVPLAWGIIAVGALVCALSIRFVTGIDCPSHVGSWPQFMSE